MGRVSQRRVAFHEAGHAVIHVLERVRFRNVTIIPAEDCLGRVELYKSQRTVHEHLHRKSRSRRESCIMAYLAGPIAEGIYRGRRVSMSESDDFRGAIQMCPEEWTDEERVDYIDWLYTHTKVLLEDPEIWKLVEEVAAALLRQKTLTSVEVRRIIHQCGE